MSDQETSADDQNSVSPEPPQTDPSSARRSVNKGGLIVGGLILVSLIWYLMADRLTPYTSQARVQGYVVGVAPKVAGLVSQVWVGNNAEVEAGQALFEIDPSHYRIALEKARSELGNARSQVEAGGASVEAARAKLRAARANETKAEKDFRRLQRLHEEDPGTISVRRLEVSSASLEQARAEVSSAEADIRRAIEQKGGDDEANNAILRSATSAVAKAELDLADTVVRAASRGVITDLRADVGQYAGAGSPVMTLIAIHDVWISAEFTENNLGNLRPDMPVDIVFDALPGKVLAGRVRSVGLGVNAGQTQPPGTLPDVQNNRDWLRQAQRFPVVIGFDVDQHETLSRQLRVGGQASVIAYADAPAPLRWLAKLFIRLMSWLSYAY